MTDVYNSESLQFIKLIEILKKDTLEPSDIRDIQHIMMFSMRGMIDFLLDASIDEIKASDYYIQSLRVVVKALRVIYNNSGSDTGATDSEYDILAEKLEVMDDLDNQIEDKVHYKDKGYHLYPCLRGTLDKIYYLSNEEKSLNNAQRRSLDDWIRTSQNKIREKSSENIDLKEEDIFVFPKWDGVSVIFEFDENGRLLRALTRGYTALNEACIVTDTFRSLFDKPEPCPSGKKEAYGMKTEVMTTNESLARYNKENPFKQYKNTRSFASAIINGEIKNKDLVSELKIIKLRYTVTPHENENAVQILHPEAYMRPNIQCKLKEIDKIEEFADDHHEVTIMGEGEKLRCDGAVIYLINSKIKKILGRENDKEKSEVAYKFTEEYAYVKVLDVKYSVGMYGTITPVLELEPTKMKGNKITNVSLGSINKLKELNLGKKDIVKIGYDIIPVCTFDPIDPKCKHSDHPRFEPPKYCPICGKELEYSDLTATCRNAKCPSRMMGRIKTHVQRVRMRSVGTYLIEVLYYEGIVRDIPDLYKLADKKSKLLKIPNFGNKKFNTLMKDIEAVKNTPIDEARLLSSLSLERLSYATFRRILMVYNLHELLDIVDNAEFEKLEKIQGIGSTTARWVVTGLANKRNRRNLAFLEGVLTVVEVGKDSARYELCFSSFDANDNRVKKVEDLVYEQGGEIVDSVTKSTNFLIIPDHSVVSNKVKKAEKYGIPIFTAEEFIQRLIPTD